MGSEGGEIRSIRPLPATSPQRWPVTAGALAWGDPTAAHCLCPPTAASGPRPLAGLPTGTRSLPPPPPRAAKSWLRAQVGEEKRRQSPMQENVGWGGHQPERSSPALSPPLPCTLSPKNSPEVPGLGRNRGRGCQGGSGVEPWQGSGERRPVRVGGPAWRAPPGQAPAQCCQAVHLCGGSRRVPRLSSLQPAPGPRPRFPRRLRREHPATLSWWRLHSPRGSGQSLG